MGSCYLLLQGKFLSDVSMDDILDNIHLTGKEASKNLGLGTCIH